MGEIHLAIEARAIDLLRAAAVYVAAKTESLFSSCGVFRSMSTSSTNIPS
jgi:hypothetical protein